MRITAPKGAACGEQSHGIAGRHLENVAIQKVLADYVLVPARNRTQYEIPPTRKLLGLGEELHLHLEHSPQEGEAKFGGKCG